MRDNLTVQSAFGTVVWVVSILGIVGAVLALALNRRTWDAYGRDHLVRDSELTGVGGVSGSRVMGAAAVAERDEEVRQMLEAGNARRRRRGETELDIEAELVRLTAPTVDDELRSEIRDLVIARNHRRARRGQPALDVEAEVKRHIAELGRT
jgi:hypothetical protein